jgi:cell cycle checkpoint protein
VVVDSDDEGKAPETPTKSKSTIEAAFARAGSVLSPTKPTRLPNRPASSIPSQRSKPSTPSSKSNSPAKKPESRNKKINSFFNAATEREPLNRSNSPEKAAVESLDLEDDVIQDSSDDGETKPPPARVPSTNGFHKRKLDDSLDNNGNSITHGGQKFLKPSQDRKVPTKLSDGTSVLVPVQQKPWTDEYAPANLEELAVHKRKVADLKECLARTIKGTARSRLIVLKGGAGTGKTTTLRLIAESLGLRVTEWRNPDSNKGQEAGTSIAAQFEEFINRTSFFGTLNFGEARSSAKTEDEDSRGYLVLVEEFPNTFSKSSSTVQGFRRAVLQYLSTSTPSADEYFMQRFQDRPAVVPIVMVISESLLSTTTASADSFTAHRLLGPEILSHPGTATLEFNPVAPTFMLKALDLVLRKEARKSGRRFAPGPAVLKHLSEIGDVRSAVSALEFFCVHQGSEEDWSGKISFGKTKRSSDVKALTSMESQSLQMITQRENTLGIFHAVGRVLYNKREAPGPNDNPPPQPPAHFPQYRRLKVSEVDVDNLLNELGTEIQIFISALHENYVLSCTGLDGEETLDSINGCIDSLSEADLLCPERFTSESTRSTWQATANDALRQDAISFFSSVQGCLFYLPHPVKRSNPPADYIASTGKSGGKNAAFQMYYPTSMRLWRRKEQIEELIEEFTSKFRRGELDRSDKSRSAASGPGGVESWGKRGHRQETETKSNEDGGLRLCGTTKDEVLLERLPGMNLLQRRKPVSQRSPTSQLIYKIVHLGGLSSSLTSQDDEEGNAANELAHTENWSTDKPTEELHNQKWRKSLSQIKKKEDGNLTTGHDVEKLVLSDDDIEDDD